MKHKKTSGLILACAFLANAACCLAQETLGGPEALIARARRQEEIWTKGTPPMLMRAELQVPDSRGGMIHGEYTFNWESPVQWKEEIRLGDYDRLRVGDAKGYWQQSGFSYQPEIIFLLDRLLHWKEVFRVDSKQTLGKVKSRDKAGVRQLCTEVKETTGVERILCFDQTNGALVSLEYPSAENQHPPEITRIEYGAFKSVEGKLVPYEIRALQDRNTIAVVKILEIAKISEGTPQSFKVPENSEFWEQCDDLQGPELLKQVQPKYPPGARNNHEQGRVILYAVIETDGSLSQLTIIHRATPDLEAAAMEAVSQWRYKPASCAQAPIRQETSIETDFWLQN